MKHIIDAYDLRSLKISFTIFLSLVAVLLASIWTVVPSVSGMVWSKVG